MPLSKRLRGLDDGITISPEWIEDSDDRVDQAAQQTAAEVHQHKESYPAHRVISAPGGVGKEMAQDVTAVQGRDGYQIEDAQHDIDPHELVEEQSCWHEN